MAALLVKDFEETSSGLADEDEDTLRAIDEAVKDCEAGLGVSSDKVRELLPQWITASSSRRQRQATSKRSLEPLITKFTSVGR